MKGAEAECVECHGLQNAQDRDLLQLECMRAFNKQVGLLYWHETGFDFKLFLQTFDEAAQET